MINLLDVSIGETDVPYRLRDAVQTRRADVRLQDCGPHPAAVDYFKYLLASCTMVNLGDTLRHKVSDSPIGIALVHGAQVEETGSPKIIAAGVLVPELRHVPSVLEAALVDWYNGSAPIKLTKVDEGYQTENFDIPSDITILALENATFPST